MLRTWMDDNNFNREDATLAQTHLAILLEFLFTIDVDGCPFCNPNFSTNWENYGAATESRNCPWQLYLQERLARTSLLQSNLCFPPVRECTRWLKILGKAGSDGTLLGPHFFVQDISRNCGCTEKLVIQRRAFAEDAMFSWMLYPKFYLVCQGLRYVWYSHWAGLYFFPFGPLCSTSLEKQGESG